MNLSNLKPATKRRYPKYVGRGGKRGTTSGGGTKGQKSRAGAGVRAGFRGGDNRLWQLFPKQRGASKKPGGGGNDGPHRKHRFFQTSVEKPYVFNLDFFNQYPEGTVLNLDLLKNKKAISSRFKSVKILGQGSLKRKLIFEGFDYSASAREKILKSGSQIMDDQSSKAESSK